MMLRPRQVEDVAYLMTHPRGGLFHDPAVGKTPPVCVYMWWLWDELKVKSAFVMPLSLMGKNRAELLAWSGFEDRDVQILTEAPAEVRVLFTIYAAQQGWLRMIETSDAKMMGLLQAAKRGHLGAGDKGWNHFGDKFLKSVGAKALKNGWIRPLAIGEGPMQFGMTVDEYQPYGLTDDGKIALASGLRVNRYAIQKPRERKAEFLPDTFVQDMIKRGILTPELKPGPNTNEPTFMQRLLEPLVYDAKVLLMGFDHWAANWRWLKQCNPQLGNLVGEEIHMGFGHHDSQRTQSFYESMKVIERFVPMTGTLINGQLATAYPTIHVIEPRFYASHDDFLSRHELRDIWGKRNGWTGHQQLGDVIRSIGRRRTFEEEYGKEAKLLIKEVVEMSPSQRAAYDEFHEKAILELEDRFLDGTLPGVATIRARQIMQCPEIFGLCRGEETGKDGFLRVHLADAANTGKPIVIFAVFQAEQERLMGLVQEYNIPVALINSNVSIKRRQQIDEDFRTGKLQGIVASTATAGVGFNWERTGVMVVPSLDYQDGNFKQAYLRAIRGKRDTPLLLYVLEYARSIDQRIFQIVDGKSRDAHLVDPTREVLTLSA